MSLEKASFGNEGEIIEVLFKKAQEKLGADVLIFRRNVGLFRAFKGDRVIKVGEVGQADVYGFLKNGIPFEIEVKFKGAQMTKKQRAWASVCKEFKIPHFVARGDNIDEIIGELNVLRSKR